jgi:class 3 adenylate cyclase/tetratricopeptide (TPR) repeat protein
MRLKYMIRLMALCLWIAPLLSAVGGKSQQDAITALQQKLKKDPNSAILHYNLGVAYHRVHRLEEAASAYLRAIALKEDFHKAHFNLGVLRVSQGRFAEAVELFEAVQRFAPDFRDVEAPLAAARLFLRADSALAQRQYTEAVELFERYLRLNPGDPFATARLEEARAGEIFARGVEAEQRGELEEAIRIFEELDTSYADVGRRLAELRRRLKADTIAQAAPPVASKEPLVEMAAARPELLERYERGIEALSRGDFVSAIAELNRVVEEQPDFRDAPARLKAAREGLSNAVSKYYRQGLAHLRKEKWSEAERSFAKVLSLEPNHLEAKAGRLVVAGWRALEDNDAVEAEAQARAALQLVAGFAPAERLRRTVEQHPSPPVEMSAAEPGTSEEEKSKETKERASEPAGQITTAPRINWPLWGVVFAALVLLVGGMGVVVIRRRRSVEPAPGTAPYVSGSEVVEELSHRGPTTAAVLQGRDLRDVRQLSRYELRGEVGRGAMGIAYKAWDPKLERTVVLKTIRFDVLSDLLTEFSDVKERFFREARAAGKLNHPNIVTVYDVAEEDDVWFIVMEYLEGETLGEILSRERVLGVRRVMRIIKQVCSALEYAHSHGVIHRDIKPSNIMAMEGDQIKVMDFGIAKLSASTMTSTGSLMGTASYMSPEQISGQQIDGRTDIFSMGILTYELLTGQRPFQGETIPTLMYEILNHDPTPPTRLNPSITPLMDEIIAKALAKDREQRYSSAKELFEDLERAEHGYLTEAIMVVDICESSRIAEKYGNRFAERLFDQFQAIMKECLEEYRPSFVKDTGDGVMATFPTGREAVSAAIQFEQYLARHNQSVSQKERIHTRVGIHFGETRVTEFGDRHSADVNIAFRVQGLSRDDFIEEPGGLRRRDVPEQDRIFVTQHVFEDVQGASEFKTRPIGFFEMKNIYGRHKIYEVLWS